MDVKWSTIPRIYLDRYPDFVIHYKKGVFNHQIIEQIIKISLEYFISHIHAENISSVVKNVSGLFHGENDVY